MLKDESQGLTQENLSQKELIRGLTDQVNKKSISMKTLNKLSQTKRKKTKN